MRRIKDFLWLLWFPVAAVISIGMMTYFGLEHFCRWVRRRCRRSRTCYY